MAVPDLHPRHRGVTIGREHLAGHPEHLIRPFAIGLPHRGDGRQPFHRLQVWTLPVPGVVSEEPGQRAGAGRPPGPLVGGQPCRHLAPVHLSPDLSGAGRTVAVVTSDSALTAAGATADDYTIPAVPASAGALIFDRAGRLLILKPSYKSGWTIPGGVMEADGETPWQACQREVREECGLSLTSGRLACVDFRPPRPGRAGGIRFLFDCGAFADTELARISLQAEELSAYQFVDMSIAMTLLRKPIRRRVRAATSRRGLLYLEDGRPVPGVRASRK